ncbi:MAG TPA: ABC transporter permease [Stackebrandtia sp.]|uniref:ABC transporter permease n=1 Tax=Stackebrandtia sp. TaxID=2023065 RepID=UPI002D6BB979|nr:ABC transporter permease [Stackebrandtia sp.]HZE41137.1 ABC transporter permease [Stackebrandtia sp.]
MSADTLRAPVADRLSLRLLRGELRFIATRRRNQIALAVLCGVPVVLALVLKLSGAAEHTASAPPMVAMMFGNGMLVVLAAFSVESLIFLPLAVAVLSADAVSGEAAAGTLRYLLTVPIGRTRLLCVKFAANAIAVVAAVAAVALCGAIAGIAAFGAGDLVTLSGSTIPFGDSLGRVALVCLYVMAMMIAFSTVTLFAATCTDHPATAIVGSLLYVLCDQLLVSVPELDWLDPYLLTGYWRDWGDLVREPVQTGNLTIGLVVAGVYAAVFASAAWARFTTRDITC